MSDRAILDIESEGGNENCILHLPPFPYGHYLFVQEGLKYQPSLVGWLCELVRRLATNPEPICENCYWENDLKYCQCGQNHSYTNKSLLVQLGSGCYQVSPLCVFPEKYNIIPALADLVQVCAEVGVEIQRSEN